jgi:drug/metabolite transporter (DMT)-like permease
MQLDRLCSNPIGLTIVSSQAGYMRDHVVSATSRERAQFLQVFVAFVAIYLIWGSTFLAIRFADETIPPLINAGLRQLIAGAILLAWCWKRGSLPEKRHLLPAIVLGGLFFLGGHGTLYWAEKRVPSGLAALFMSTEAIIIALLGAVVPPKVKPTGKSWLGLAIGTIGVALLMGSDVFRTSLAGLLAGMALLFSSASWSIGVVYSRRAVLPRDPYLNASLTMIAGGVLLFLTAGIAGEFAGFHPSKISLRSGLSLGYLILFGSVIAYSAYMWLLEHRSPTLVATHTFVNPVVAVMLGWLLASEPLGLRTIVAGALIIGAIMFVGRGTKDEVVQPKPSSERREFAAALADD